MIILDANTAYTFSKIFELKIPADELAEEFGYRLSKTTLVLPQYAGELDRVEELRSRIKEVLPYVDLSNDASRREILIGKVATELIHDTKAKLRTEYPIVVTSHLQGYLAYLFRGKLKLLVIEAKRQELDHDMPQLVAEMITLNQ